MANTRCLATLEWYKNHFRQYGVTVKFNVSIKNWDTLGIIENKDGNPVFKPVLYNGKFLFERNLKS